MTLPHGRRGPIGASIAFLSRNHASMVRRDRTSSVAYPSRLATCESKAPMHSAGNVTHHNATMGVTTA
jgi:hypothetical protein